VDFELTDEQKQYQQLIRTWVDDNWPKSRAREIESREYQYPVELWDDFSKLGLHRLTLSPDYGGDGADVLTQAIAARELARSLGHLTWVWGITSFCGLTVQDHGSPALKDELLPAVASGKARFTISVTEPDGGTDLLGALSTRAAKVDGGWVIRGSKVWSTGAQAADYLLVLARTSKGERKSQGTSCFVVPRRAEGVETTLLPKLGMRCLGSCEVRYDDKYLVGEEGRGWYQMLGGLNNERILQAAVNVGVLDSILEDAVNYSKQRTAFGKPIGQFQAVQHFIADIALMRETTSLLMLKAASVQARGEEAGLIATMAKIVASEAATNAADLGIQILGGMGYSMETDMQRFWRDARLSRIGPVNNEMARSLVAEWFGLPRAF